MRQTSIRRKPVLKKPLFAGIRKDTRKAAALEVIVQDEKGWEIPFESVNISATGIFIRSMYLFDVGQVHRLILCLPGTQRWIDVYARITRVETSTHGVVPGMAYEFITDDVFRGQEQQQALQKFVETL